MNFDFLELYKDHSNVQLLHILENPDGYQPSAVNAARELLAGRTVTDADLAAVNPPISQTNVFEEESIADLVDRLTNPSSVNSKWVMPFILAVIAYCGHEVFNYLQLLWASYQIGFAGYWLPVMLVATITYNILSCLLLFKRNSWGWILFAAREVFVLTANIGRTATYMSERGEHTFGASFLMGQVLLNVAFLALLWSAPISTAYKIQSKIKTGYVVIGLILALRAVYIGYTTANIHM